MLNRASLIITYYSREDKGWPMIKNSTKSNDSNISVGRRIRGIRSAYGLTQESLSEDLGISPNYLGEIERGRRPLSHKVAKRLCTYFHLSLDYLYNGKPLIEETAAASAQAQEAYAADLTTLLSTCSPQEYNLCLILIRDLLKGLRSANFTGVSRENEDDVQEYETEC